MIADTEQTNDQLVVLKSCINNSVTYDKYHISMHLVLSIIYYK